MTQGAALARGVKLAVMRWPRTGASWYGLSFNALLRRSQLFHLELVGGEWEGDNPAWSMRGWLGEHNRRRIGFMTIGRQRGVLYDHPQVQGVFHDHLTFLWKKREITYAASLHSWTPPEDTRRVLAAVITGLRPTMLSQHQ